jgi:peptidoglycan/LPS O-acetylase OafA/YrhL
MQEHVTEVRPSWGRRLAGIEGLRAIAALSVVFYHVRINASTQDYPGLIGNLFAFTNQGLTLFFVLSGFLLYRPFVTAVLEGKPTPSVRRYAWNRFLRIAPAYMIIFVVAALIVGAVYIQGSTHGFGSDNIGRLTDPGRVAANLFLVQTYIPQYVMSGLGVSWSLTAEVAFYVALPVTAFLAVRLTHRGLHEVAALAAAPILMIGLGLAITAWGKIASRNLQGDALSAFEWGQTSSAVLLRSFLSQADLFAYGMLAALAVAVLHERRVVAVSTRVKVVILGAAALLVIGAITVLHPLVSNVTGAASALLIIAVVLPSGSGQANVLARALEWLPFRFTGLISYSLYLWHLPVILWLITHGMKSGADAWALPVTMGLVLAIAVPLSAATYYLVERPAMRRKKRIVALTEVQQPASV